MTDINKNVTFDDLTNQEQLIIQQMNNMQNNSQQSIIQPFEQPQMHSTNQQPSVQQPSVQQPQIQQPLIQQSQVQQSIQQQPIQQPQVQQAIQQSIQQQPIQQQTIIDQSIPQVNTESSTVSIPNNDLNKYFSVFGFQLSRMTIYLLIGFIVIVVGYIIYSKWSSKKPSELEQEENKQ